MILILGGTREGREIASSLAARGFGVLVTVVSGYGAEMIPIDVSIEVLVLELDGGKLEQIIDDRNIRLIIDATHPYARVITGIAFKSAGNKGIPFIRYERPPALTETGTGTVYRAETYDEAAELAVSLGDTIFLTVGSKNLKPFIEAGRRVNKRIVARVLPDVKVMEQCQYFGMPSNDIIAVQGPFSLEMNLTMFREYNAGVLVTKDSGEIGGTDTKLAAAASLGIPAVIIARPDYQGIPTTADIQDIFRQAEGSFAGVR